ncbi:MAG: putative transcriptional regulator, Crp/Fnr family [Myxococcales bacterium]|nr:putative transcriptional regulator, Crp/Fnr family [Myxococcales bacterium]
MIGSMAVTNAELLKQHPLLARLSLEQVLRFAQAGELELFHPGENIVVEGTLGDALYLILSGAATVHIGSVDNRPLAMLKPGEFFGEMSLVEPAVRSATVRASDVTEVFRVPHYALSNLLEDDPVVLHLVLVTVIRVLSKRLRDTNGLVGSVEKLSEWLASSMI